MPPRLARFSGANVKRHLPGLCKQKSEKLAYLRAAVTFFDVGYWISENFGENMRVCSTLCAKMGQKFLLEHVLLTCKANQSKSLPPPWQRPE